MCVCVCDLRSIISRQININVNISWLTRILCRIIVIEFCYCTIFHTQNTRIHFNLYNFRSYISHTFKFLKISDLIGICKCNLYIFKFIEQTFFLINLRYLLYEKKNVFPNICCNDYLDRHIKKCNYQSYIFYRTQ